jgi:hypothetical protein
MLYFDLSDLIDLIEEHGNEDLKAYLDKLKKEFDKAGYAHYPKSGNDEKTTNARG